MKGKKLCIMVMSLCVILPYLCGCQSGQDKKTTRVQIGVACYNQSDTFISEMVECFKKELYADSGDEAEVTVTCMDAAGSQRTQNDQVKELISAGCNVLCVNLVDRTDPSEIIDLARDNDVPLIFFNREPVAEDMKQWDKIYYIGADAKQSGIMQGEVAADAIKADKNIDRNKDGKIQYVVLEGEPGHQDAIIRTENAVNTLQKSGIELEKSGGGIANWNRAQSQNRMIQMIGQYQNQIELVLANNDDMALGAIDAYKKLNYTESAYPVFFGIDGTSVGLEAIKDGSLAGTVYNDKEGQALAMAKLAKALVLKTGLEGLTFEKENCIYLPYSKVTLENVDEYLP